MPHQAGANGWPDAPVLSSAAAQSRLLHSPREANTVDNKVLDEISRRVDDLIANTPVEDVQKNLRALMSGWFSRLDLVTREEFDVQQSVLQRTREKLSQMEARVAELERVLGGGKGD